MEEKLDMLGKARRINITKDSTTIVAEGNEQAVGLVMSRFAVRWTMEIFLRQEAAKSVWLNWLAVLPWLKWVLLLGQNERPQAPPEEDATLLGSC